jgi:hypothetical protein
MKENKPDHSGPINTVNKAKDETKEVDPKSPSSDFADQDLHLKVSDLVQILNINPISENSAYDSTIVAEFSPLVDEINGPNQGRDFYHWLTSVLYASAHPFIRLLLDVVIIESSSGMHTQETLNQSCSILRQLALCNSGMINAYALHTFLDEHDSFIPWCKKLFYQLDASGSEDERNDAQFYAVRLQYLANHGREKEFRIDATYALKCALESKTVRGMRLRFQFFTVEKTINPNFSCLPSGHKMRKSPVRTQKMPEKPHSAPSESIDPKASRNMIPPFYYSSNHMSEVAATTSPQIDDSEANQDSAMHHNDISPTSDVTHENAELISEKIREIGNENA